MVTRRRPCGRRGCRCSAQRASGSRQRRAGRGLGPKNRRRALERCCDSILDRRLDQIRRADAIAIAAPVVAEKRATGSKLHGWIRAALAWGVAREHLESTLRRASARTLPAARKAKRHHAALPYSEVGAALDAIEASTASDSVKACLRFTVLTAGSIGRGAGCHLERDETCKPLSGAYRPSAWKVAREHRVPLSAAAVETLERARRLHSPAGCRFPVPARAGRKIHATTLAYVRDAALRGPLHGARLPLLVPGLGQRGDERAARRRGGGAGTHQVGSAVERSYARSDLFEKRRGLTNRWAVPRPSPVSPRRYWRSTR